MGNVWHSIPAKTIFPINGKSFSINGKWNDFPIMGTLSYFLLMGNHFPLKGNQFKLKDNQFPLMGNEMISME